MPAQPPWARRHRDAFLGSDAQYALFAQELTFLPLTITLDPLTGSIAPTLAISGTLTHSGNVGTGSIDSVLALSAVISLTGSKSGSVDSSLAIVGTLSHNANVGTGTIASVLALAGTLSQQTGQSGSIDSVLALAGVISVTGTLAGGIAAVSTLAGTLTLDPGQSGGVASILSVSGALSFSAPIESGSIDMRTVIGGALSVVGAMTGAISGGLVVGGSLSQVKTIVHVGNLGCGTYEVLVFLRGGKTAIGALPFTSLDWERALDRVSEANVQIDGASACARAAPLLTQIDGTRHELALYRSGVRVWAGPVVKMDLDGEQAKLTARDLAQWFYLRRIRRDIVFKAATDLSTIFQAYADEAMRLDNSPGVVVVTAPCGVLGTRTALAAAHVLAGPEMDELSRNGIDWTVVDRQVVAGGAAVPTPTTPTGVLPLLTDESFFTTPTISVDASVFGTDWLVRGGGGGGAADSIFGEVAEDPTVYGLVDQVVSEEAIQDAASAEAAARTRISLAGRPLAIVTQGILSPTAGVTIGQLVPGAPIAVRLVESVKPVVTTVRLSAIKVSADASGGEQVTASFQPLGTLPNQDTTTP